MLDPNQNPGGFIVTIVTIPFLIFIGILFIVMLRNVRKGSASKRWPMTDGRILSSEVTSHRSLDSNGTHTTMYEPAVQYEYNANGQRYQSKEIGFGGVAAASMPSFAEGVVAKYPVGNSVQVFYNPAKPSEAVLEHSGAGCNMVLLLIFGAIELGLVVLLVAGLTGKLN